MKPSSIAANSRQKIVQEVGNVPCVSIILPFEPKMTAKAQLRENVKCAIIEAEAQLTNNYPQRSVARVAINLQAAMSELDYNTYAKSIAILVAPDSRRTYYLDMLVNRKVIVDDSFEIRDLVRNKKEEEKYLLLMLSAESAKIYRGGSGRLEKILSNTSPHAQAYTHDLPEKVANFSDPLERKEIMLKKFLMHTDTGLNILLHAEPLPLFVMGNDRVIGHFRKISRNLKSVVDYIHADLIHAREEKLQQALQPYIGDWKMVKQKHLISKVDSARGDGRLASGVIDVWSEAMQNKGMLLVVEKNYVVQAVKRNGSIAKVDTGRFYRDRIIKDAVDDIIEKVLSTGGDVEFVEDGALKAHERIALILYY